MKIAPSLAGLLLLAAACQHSPAAPTSVALLVTPDTLTVARNATGSITVQVQRSNGTTEAVTGAAVWTSSAPDVVTVQAGVVKAVGAGTATVTVTYGGLTRTVNVVARRNTRLTGAITVEDSNGFGSIHEIRAFVDGHTVYGLSFSSSERAYTIPLGDPQSAGFDTSVAPGSVRLSVQVVYAGGFGGTRYATRPASYVDVRDLDTNEMLARLPLSVQTATVASAYGEIGELAWTLTIDVFH
jgi:hypothetical protein